MSASPAPQPHHRASAPSRRASGSVRVSARAAERWQGLSLRAQLWVRGGVSAVAWACLSTLAHRVVASQPAMVSRHTVDAALWAIAAGMLAYLIDAAVCGAERSLRDAAEAVRELAEGGADVAPLSLAAVGAHRSARELHESLDRLALAVAEREQIYQSDMLQLKEVEQLKSDFVSTVSHELRTPLTSMRGAIGLVLGGATGEVPVKARQLLQIASQSTERLIRLINDILDIEKIEAGHVPIRADCCEVGDALRLTARGLETYALEAGVRISVHGTPSAAVLGDADRLVQLFTNLVANAVKFSPRGGEVRATADVVGDRVVVRVRDDGPGIPEEFQSRIFGKFQQADSGSARTRGGTGLGLTIARAITEQHGGTIAYETAPGAGTTFVVTLPLLAAAPVGVRDASGSYPAWKGRRVLVVDTDDGIVDVLAALCQSFATVDGTASAEAAWEQVRAGGVDAVVIDPEVAGGTSLVRRLHGTATYMPVLVFSGREYRGDDAVLLGVPTARTFVKSRDSEGEIVLRLRAMLEAHGAQQRSA